VADRARSASLEGDVARRLASRTRDRGHVMERGECGAYLAGVAAKSSCDVGADCMDIGALMPGSRAGSRVVGAVGAGCARRASREATDA